MKPFPFAALVGQDEAKLAALLTAVNPRSGGVLLTGPKGIGKTSIVRALADLLPMQRRALCEYGCDPGSPLRCETCAKLAPEQIKTKSVRAEIVELPANAQIDDLVGTIDLRAALERGTVGFRPGLLARAHRSILYVDEINLLSDVVVDALLDAAATGVVRVKRGQQSVEYPSRFTLIGTMNPEEGELRPQIADRLGLRVFVRAAESAQERIEIYQRNAEYARDPDAFAAAYAGKTRALRTKIAKAIERLDHIRPEPSAQALAIEAVMRLGIESHRTEFVALEAACALAAYEGRESAGDDDVRRVFPLAARLRRSRLRVQAVAEYQMEDSLIEAALQTQPESEGGDRADAAEQGGGAIVVAPEFSQRERSRATTSGREGQPIASRSHTNGRVDVPATVLSAGIAKNGAQPGEVRESVDAARPARLTVFVVDASQSTAASASAVHAAMTERLRPIYAEREFAALISCWGPHAEIVVDEQLGRNIEIVAQHLSELEPDQSRALTPLPEALEHARRIAARFLRAHPSAEVEVAIFSDGRANVPLGSASDLERLLTAPASDVHALLEAAAEQCRTLAARLAGRTSTTFVNLDAYETSPLMRELAEIARGKYYSLSDIVAQLN